MASTILRGIRVLLLEDDAIINLATAATIEEFGCVVRACIRLTEAFEAVRKEPPDIAVLDVNVGGTTSLEFAERLNEMAVPIIFLTGYESPAIIGKWRDRPHCRKPFARNELEAVMIGVLNPRSTAEIKH